MSRRKLRLRCLYASLAILAAPVLAGCAVPGLQAYWDAKVDEMCAKDGGVRIFEHISVTPDQLSSLPRVAGFLGVSSEELAKPGEPAYSRIRRDQIRGGSPSVVRYETQIIRRTDQRVVAVAVTYARAGGDLVVIDHPSTYSCPSRKEIYAGIDKVYRIQGVTK